MAEPVRTTERLRMVAPTVSVGMLTADLLSLGAELQLLEKVGVQIVHFDVMDGCFCPMMTVGPPVIKAVKTPLLKDVHLMIEDPLPKLESYVAAGADMVTVHVEATPHAHRALQVLGQMTNVNDPRRGIARGIALNPGTPLSAAEPLFADVDVIFLLAVNPGWGGQSFIPSTHGRLAALLEMVRQAKRDILIGIDGGIKRDNIEEVARMGADIIVTGSAVFDGKTPEQNATDMLEAIACARRM